MQIRQSDDITSKIYQDALSLRKAVFVEEQGVASDLELANETGPVYFVGYLADKPVATARAFEEEAGVWHIQRVAVSRDHRGQGLAKELFAKLEQVAKEYQIKKLTLGAQDQAQGFYLKLGYHVVGAGFMEAGIAHHQMEKLL